jgi:spore maturation protein CgeB
MKTFELPACGAFVLSNRTDEQVGFFPEGQCADYFSTQDEMIKKVELYLSNTSAREQIRHAAAEQVKPHCYRERARQVLNIWCQIEGLVSCP